MVGGTRRVPRWWLASRSETHTLGLERVKEAFPFNAEFPATSDPPELRAFQSGVRARSSTFLAGGSSPGDQLFESRAFRKSESPRPHRPTCRSTPECSPASANGQQVRSNPSLLAAGANIGVANERHVLDLLKAHYVTPANSDDDGHESHGCGDSHDPHSGQHENHAHFASSLSSSGLSSWWGWPSQMATARDSTGQIGRAHV